MLSRLSLSIGPHWKLAFLLVGKWPHTFVLIRGMRALTHVHDTDFRRQRFNMKVTALVRGAMIHFFHRYEQQMKPAFIFSLTASIYLGLASVYGL